MGRALCNSIYTSMAYNENQSNSPSLYVRKAAHGTTASTTAVVTPTRTTCSQESLPRPAWMDTRREIGDLGGG